MFIATRLTQGPSLLTDHAGQQVVAELPGLGDTPLRESAAQLGDSRDARAHGGPGLA